jgi:hypothetical protein
VSIDWGSVPAWVGSILTGSSLLIAANAYRLSVSERIQQQAMKVTAWIAEAGAELANGEKSTQDMLYVRNASDAAAYFVVLQHSDVSTPGPTGISGWRSIGPETTVSAISGVPAGQLLPSALMFIDAGGQPWRRSRTGQLSRPARRKTSSAALALESYFGLDDLIFSEEAVTERDPTTEESPK